MSSALSSRASVYHALAYGFEVSIVTFSYKFASLVKVSWPQCCWNANSILRAYDYSRCDLNSHTIDREPSINWLTRQCVNSTCKAQIPHGLCESSVSVFFHAIKATSSLKWRRLFSLALRFSGPNRAPCPSSLFASAPHHASSCAAPAHMRPTPAWSPSLPATAPLYTASTSPPPAPCVVIPGACVRFHARRPCLHSCALQ